MWEELIVGGGLGLGLYILWHRPTSQQKTRKKILIERPYHPLNQQNIHEAMGPQFAGKRVQDITKTEDKYFRERVRPGLSNVKPNQSIKQIIPQLNKLSADAYANVKTKMNRIYGSNRNKIPQDRITRKFQVVRAL